MDAIRWAGDAIEITDQTLLPDERRTLSLKTVTSLCLAVQQLRLRGAPALGLAGAYGVALAVREANPPELSDYPSRVRRLAEQIAGARPTAVNLAWGVEQVLTKLDPTDLGAWPARALELSFDLHKRERLACESMAIRGAEFIRPGGRYITHCNAGPLATGGMGSALGVFLEARRRGLDFEVLVDETRPLLQGARLTTLELMEAGIRVRLITDSMAAFAMSRLGVDGVFIGADRIAVNGDTANKIGSYGLALAAAAHRVPFHVVAPLSTFDSGCPDGSGIPLEERDPAELRGFAGLRWAPLDVPGWNPAFDVVPAALIQDIVTEHAILRHPLQETIRLALEWRDGNAGSPDVPRIQGSGK